MTVIERIEAMIETLRASLNADVRRMRIRVTDEDLLALRSEWLGSSPLMVLGDYGEPEYRMQEASWRGIPVFLGEETNVELMKAGFSLDHGIEEPS